VRPRDLIFLKDVLVIGVTAFGGPQSHIAVFQRTLVEKRRYLTDDELMELNAMCNMLPGPSSTQTICAIALKRGGTLLAVLTLLLWMLPAVTAMTLVTVLFNTIDKRGLTLDVFRFVQPVAIALIAYSGLRIGTNVLKNHLGKGLMVFGLLATILYPQPWTFPSVLLLGGLATAFTKHEAHSLREELRMIDWHRSWVSLGLFIGVFAIAAILGAVTQYKPFVLFENCYRFGALTFGGGNVLVPMMFEQFVKYRHYLSAEEFVSGFAINQAMPGPVFAFAAFAGGRSLHSMGYSLQVLGCVLSAVAIFLPGLLSIFVVFPYWQMLKRHRATVRALEGVNAVAVGLILGSAVVLYTNLPFHWINSLVMIAAFLLLDKVKMKVPPLVLLALLGGFVYHYINTY